MKSQTYVQGYSLEGLRDVCDQVKEDSEVLSEGYYIDDTLKKLFHMTYFGYPENLEEYKKAIEIEKTCFPLWFRSFLRRRHENIILST